MGSSPSRPIEPKVPKDEIDEKCLSSTAVSPSGALTLSNVASWETELSQSPKALLARTILSHSDIRSALVKRDAFINTLHVFNTSIDFKTGPVTNQKSSGRCWLFATTNVLRYEVMRTAKLDAFEISQSYLYFWDKLNKCNYYLELTLENAHLPIDDRLITHLSNDLISDGGQFDMAVNLCTNYGIVPQSVYPESTHSSMTGPLNTLLKLKLREHALVLRRLSSSNVLKETLRAEKERLMKDIYTILTATLGVPPLPTDTFLWEYTDKDGKAGRWEGSPVQFYESFAAKPYPLSECFSLINDPRNDYSKLYTVDKLGNVWGGRPVLYVNTEIENMKAMVVKMIKANRPVFFGCDVGQSSERVAGLMATDLYAYEAAFDITLTLTKSERLQVNESAMTHAMAITAVHLDPEGAPVRYKVENSWGTEAGEKGFFVMTDKWFEEYVYQIVVPKAMAPKVLVKVLESEPVVLPPWDPMGALA